MTSVAKLAQLLDELEAQMKNAELWGMQSPSQQALLSTQPFAIDTLQPEQWLQWIFIEKMKVMLEQNQALPRGFSISPYFSEAWKNNNYCDVLATLYTIDEACA